MIKFQDVNAIESQFGDLASVKNIDDVINISITFDKPIKICDRQDSSGEYKETLGYYAPEYEKKFGQHGGVISFFYNGLQYEVHHTKNIEKILIENGFKYDPTLGSTLSGGTIPYDFQDFWQRQSIEASQISGMEMLIKRDKAIKKSIEQAKCTPISQELITTRCFKVPVDGFDVIDDSGRIYQQKPFKREMNEYLTLEKLENLVGKMSKYIAGGGKSGQRTFVYLDGRTYVTDSEEVIRELFNNGFVESDDVEHLGVGWSFKIVDPYYASKYKEKIISDKLYLERKKSSKDYIDRKIEHLESKNNDLESSNNELINSLVMIYIKYKRKKEEEGIEPKSIRDYLLDELNLDLSENVMEVIDKKIK